MKSKVALLCLSIVLLLTAIGMVAGQGELQVIMTPASVTLPRSTTQWFYANMSDGSPIAACEWTATGVGQNGVSLFYTANAGAFNTGTLPGVTYYISCICSNTSGITVQGSATVAVHH